MAPLVIAHRGAHGAFGSGRAENTLAAFEHALALGADAIELDVRRCAGGELVVFHDARCMGRSVSSLTPEELSRTSGREVPLLAEVLAWALVRGAALDVELKEGGYVGQVARGLRAFASAGGQVLVTSFLDGVLLAARRLAPELPRGLLLERRVVRTFRACERAARCGATALVVPVGLLDDALLRQASTAGVRCVAWDVLASRDEAWIGDERLAGVITDDVAGAHAGVAGAHTGAGRRLEHASILVG